MNTKHVLCEQRLMRESQNETTLSALNRDYYWFEILWYAVSNFKTRDRKAERKSSRLAVVKEIVL